jgi:hypothetical protein
MAKRRPKHCEGRSLCYTNSRLFLGEEYWSAFHLSLLNRHLVTLQNLHQLHSGTGHTFYFGIRVMARASWASIAMGTVPPFRDILPSRIAVCVKVKYLALWSDILIRRHLLGVGRRDEAKKVIAELNSVPVDDELVEETVEELSFAINAENEGGKATWLECFSTRNSLWKRTINGMMLMLIQQLNGQNFYYYYGDTFFAEAGTG